MPKSSKAALIYSSFKWNNFDLRVSMESVRKSRKNAEICLCILNTFQVYTSVYNTAVVIYFGEREMLYVGKSAWKYSIR